MERKQTSPSVHAGFTILDTVLGLFVVGTVVLMFAGLISAREANRRVIFRTQASALVDEQINRLKRIGFANLANQTNGSFQNILYNGGAWSIGTNGVPVSTPNTLELAANANMTNTVSGRLLFPAGAYDNGTFEAKFKIAAGSPTGSAVGFAFRSQNSSNGYRFRIAPTGTDLDGGTVDGHNVVIEKIVSGTTSYLLGATSTITISPDTWYTLQLVLAATTPTIKAYINGNQQDLNTISDATYLNGAVALIGWGGVHAYVDDAKTITAGTDTWGFDASTDFPAAWIRLGLNDLPDTTPNTFDDNGILTISAYPDSSAQNLKQAIVIVRWVDNGKMNEYQSTVLIGKSEIGL